MRFEFSFTKVLNTRQKTIYKIELGKNQKLGDCAMDCVQTIPNDAGTDIHLDYLNDTKI